MSFHVPDDATATAVYRIQAILRQIQTRKLKEITDTELAWASRLNAHQIRDIHRIYRKTHEDLRLALKGDEYAQESYSHFKPLALPVAGAFLSEIFRLRLTVPEPIKRTKPKPKSKSAATPDKAAPARERTPPVISTPAKKLITRKKIAAPKKPVSRPKATPTKRPKKRK